MTTFSLPSLVSPRAVLIASLLLSAGCTSPRVQSPPPASAVPADQPKPGAFNDDPRPMNANEAAVAAAGLDSKKLAALERQLLAILLDPTSAADAAQDAAQQLGFVVRADSSRDSSATLAALAPLLADTNRSDYARLVLDRVAGPAVDALYLRALTTATGRTRVGLIDASGTRGIAQAVPVLAPLINEADSAAAAAAATAALGRIGGSAALVALGESAHPLAPTVLTARLAAAAKINATTTAQVAAEISRNPQAPLPARAAALRQLITASPATAAAEIDAALTGTEPAFRDVALEAVATLGARAAITDLAQRTINYPPATQVRLVSALGHTGEAAVVPALWPLLASPESSVRIAAIEALGRLPGNAETMEKLAALAGTGDDIGKAALAASTRLDGPGLDSLVQQAAADSARSEAARVVFIQLIGTRNLTEAIPFLFTLRDSPTAALRFEALDALRAIAAPTDQAAVIAWATNATDRTEQTRAVRALITILLRDGRVETRATPVIAALKAGNAAERQILMPVLSRVGGAAALEAASTLARSPDTAVALAATGELSRWPDASALPVLVQLAASTDSEKIRTALVQGAARFLTQANDAVAENRSSHTRVLLGLPATTSMKQSLLQVLSLCADQAALDTARQFLTDAALASVAQDAVDAITANLAGPALITASVDSAKATAVTDGKLNTFWQVPGENGTWLRADLHHARPVRKISLLHGTRGWGYPAKFDVQVSNDPEQPGAAVAQGKGQKDLTVVTLPAGVHGRYLWIRVTADRDTPLAIAELRVE